MPTATPSSLEIAQAAQLRPITEIAAAAGLEPDEVDLVRHATRRRSRSRCSTGSPAVPTGSSSASPRSRRRSRRGQDDDGGLAHAGPRRDRPQARALPPRGVARPGVRDQGRRRRRAATRRSCPMEDMNLHFTGDIHAIGAANNLLAAMLEAHLLHGNKLGIDPLSISLAALRRHQRPRAARHRRRPRRPRERLPAPDRLRHHRRLRGDGDRRRRARPPRPARAARRDHGRRDVRGRARDRRAAEGGRRDDRAAQGHDQAEPRADARGPAGFVHCGPFANIAHGNNSLVADRVALKLGDYVVTESGFGSRHGHGEVLRHRLPRRRADAERRRARRDGEGAQAPRRQSRTGGVEAIEAGSANLARHLGIVREFGLNAVVAVNRFPADTDEEIERSAARARARRVRGRGERGRRARRRGRDGAGGGRGRGDRASRRASTPIYALDDVDRAEDRDDRHPRLRRGRDPPAGGRAREDRASSRRAASAACRSAWRRRTSRSRTTRRWRTRPPASPSRCATSAPYTGAGWLVALCGDMQTMPGYGRTPAAHRRRHRRRGADRRPLLKAGSGPHSLALRVVQRLRAHLAADPVAEDVDRDPRSRLGMGGWHYAYAMLAPTA